MPNTEYIIKYLSDTKEAITGAKRLEQINKDIASNIGQDYANAVRIVGQSFNKLTTTPKIINGKEINQTLDQLSQVVQVTDGRFLEFTKTTKLLNGQVIGTSGALKDVTNQFRQTPVEIEKNNRATKNLWQNLIFLGQRALFVIPIWGALRNATIAFTNAISNSFAGIEKESLALDKAKQTLTGTTAEIIKNLRALNKESESLAITTGVSQDKIIEVFRRFSAVGFDYTTAMSATNAITKLAVITQTDASESADSFANSLNILIDKSKSATEQGKQITEIFALITELAQKNGFDINTFANSLEKFAVTAKSANFTTGQTVALLATLSKSGLGEAGNVFRNSINQLLGNLDKLASSLGIKVNPELDNTFTILMKVLEQIKKLQDTKDLTGLVAAKDALKELFGGIRGSVPITALATLYDSLQQNLSLVPDIDNFNQKFNESEQVVGNLIKRIKTLGAETGEAFFTGLLGAQDYQQALIKLVDILTQVQKNAEEFGSTLNKIFKEFSELGKSISTTGGVFNIIPNAIFQGTIDKENLKSKINTAITEALKGGLPKDELTNILKSLLEIQTFKIDIGLGDASINAAIKNIKEQILNTSKQINVETVQQEQSEKKISQILFKKEDFTKLENNLKKELNALGLSEVDIQQKILDFRVASNKFTDKELALQQELIQSLQKIESIELNRIRSRGLIDNQLEILRLLGATNLQILQRRIELEKEHVLNQSKEDLLKKELALQQEITKEKLNQNNLSSTSIKLFEISQKFGTQVASDVQRFLTGELSVERFAPGLGGGLRGSDIEKAIKEFFPSELIQQQAKAFFTSGLGVNVPIPEKQAIQEIKPIDLSSIKLPDINTQIGQINVEVKKLFKQEDTANEIVNALVDAIRNNTIVHDAINEKIDNF